jgi:FKBP-type peptidyl-prolyl cis-trans isomerase 2
MAKANGASAGVKKGDKVKVDYTGKLEDGTVFDASEKHGNPLEFEAGSGKVIRGFDEGIMGMKAGDSKTIKIPPEQAYGMPNPKMVQQIPKSLVPGSEKAQAGMMMIVTTPDGMKLPARIAAVEAETLTLDLNHPLAGKTLVFDLKVVSIN